MRRPLQLVVASACVAVLAACGLSVVGRLDVAGDGAPPGAIADDGAAPGVDAPVGGDAGAGADVVIPSCDSPDATVVFLPPDGGSCPTGTSEETARTTPVALDGACGCGTCTPTADPSCNTAGQTINARGDSNASCTMQSYDYSPANDTCTDFGFGSFDVIQYNSWSARTPTGGACTATPTPDTSKTSTTALRECVANDAVAACAPPGAGERKCIVVDGSACAAPFPVAIPVGDGATVSCGACSCVRAATKCVVDYYGDTMCTTTSKYQQDLDGMCHRTNDPTSVRTFKLHATGLTCVATPATAAATLTNPRTLCCDQ